MRQTTKEAIAQTFLELLERRSIDKITVKDIVTECGINRQTFYYHFRDIYDLMEWSLAQDIEKYVGQRLSLEENWKDQIRLLFHSFYQRRIVILHGYDATNRMQYERIAVNWISQMVRKRLDAYPQAADVPAEKKDFISTVYARGCAGFLLEWMEEGMPDERHVRLDDYFIMIDGSIGHVLDKFKKT